MKLSDYTIAICLVDYGYEIDILNHKDFLNGKVTIAHSECRDYGGNIDVEHLSSMILQLIRDAEKVLSNNYKFGKRENETVEQYAEILERRIIDAELSNRGYQEAAKANAEFICKAVNNHERLVAALQEVQNMLVHNEDEVTQNKAKFDVLNRCPNVRETMNKVRQTLWDIDK
jgi:hypothetical protein